MSLSPHKPPSEQDIVRALGSNPEQGFRLLLARYQEPLYWHIRRLVVSHDDAQDAAQETFLRIFRSFPQYRGGTSFTAWLYRIATNEALRQLARRPPTEVPADGDATALATLQADAYVDYTDLEAVRLQRAILSLPARQQLTFNLRYYDELSYDEIAEITGSTAAAAKANYHLAKEKIVRFMKSND